MNAVILARTRNRTWRDSRPNPGRTAQSVKKLEIRSRGTEISTCRALTRVNSDTACRTSSKCSSTRCRQPGRRNSLETAGCTRCRPADSHSSRSGPVRSGLHRMRDQPPRAVTRHSGWRSSSAGIPRRIPLRAQFRDGRFSGGLRNASEPGNEVLHDGMGGVVLREVFGHIRRHRVVILGMCTHPEQSTRGAGAPATPVVYNQRSNNARSRMEGPSGSGMTGACPGEHQETSVQPVGPRCRRGMQVARRWKGPQPNFTRE